VPLLHLGRRDSRRDGSSAQLRYWCV